MILGAADAPVESEPSESESTRRGAGWTIVITAIATSIDALAVGAGLAFVEVNILLTALAIGLATTLMATAGLLLGRRLGAIIGRRAEMLGGMVLVSIGTLILIDHLELWTRFVTD